jgi:hypothetical protein
VLTKLRVEDRAITIGFLRTALKIADVDAVDPER